MSGEDTDSDGCEYCGGGGNGIAGIVNSVKFFGDAINDGWSSVWKCQCACPCPCPCPCACP